MKTSRVVLAAILGAFLSGHSYAQSTLLNEVHTVTTANKPVAVEHSFDISNDGTYQVTLADLGATLTPAAPLTSVKLSITSGNKVVTGATLTAVGTTTFSAKAGTYVIHTLAVPDVTKPGSGPLNVKIDDPTKGIGIASFTDTVSFPATPTAPNQGTLDDSFSVPSSGTYQIALTDLQLPQGLASASVLILQAGGSVVTALSVIAGGATTATALVQLQPNVAYRAVGVGTAGTVTNAGLYGVVVTPQGGGAVVYGKSAPVGSVTLLGAPVLTAATYTLTLADLSFPAALPQLGAVVTVNGQLAAQLNAAGNATVTGSTNPFQIYAYAGATTSPGSYSVTLKSGAGDSALNVARLVPDSAAAFSVYSYDATAPGGALTFDLADFAVPTAFTTLRAAIVQNGAIVGTPLQAAGSPTVTPAAGPVSLLVIAQPSAVGTPQGGGLFGVDLVPSGSANAAFETTQGVGLAFSARQIPVAAAGKYGLNVTDVGYPSAFQSLYVVLTQRATATATVIAGPQNARFVFDGKPGKYFVNVVALPNATDGAGTYALVVAPQPVVTLTASATHVASGGTVVLTWSSQNATTCTASGGWSGPLDTSKSATSDPLTANTTFTVSCDGPGGTGTQSVSVTIDPPAPTPSKGGGGGAFGLGWLTSLAALAGFLLVKRARRAGAFANV